ncbi:hypothetical protein GCM10023333_22130 [Ferrimonas pelagia]|uniref:Uncharacterized protein n=1 Tax=Ferrimonas pelagia TaxID=1177826 RepID=A0ABP9EY69_9GAMM
MASSNLSPDIKILAQHAYDAPQSRSATPSPIQRYIVQLKADPIATYRGDVAGYQATASQSGDKLLLNSPSVTQYQSVLKQERSDFAQALTQSISGSKIEREFSILFHGVSIATQGVSLAEIAALPNVKAVYPQQNYYLNTDASLDLIGASEAWQQVGDRDSAGAGIKVAVIDSGIRPEHPMFEDAGFNAPGDLPGDDYCATTDPEFCNNKLIVARHSNPTFSLASGEYRSPLGYDGHGTHVAGTAVGNTVSVQFMDNSLTLSGVAPGAYLMAYKALYTDSLGAVTGTTDMLMEALEYAVADGADVINNSWGGSAGSSPSSSPYQDMFAAAEAAGVVIVTAAGNDGSSGKTIGCPGCIEPGITVGNTTHSRTFGNAFSLGDLSAIPMIEGTAPVPLDTNIQAPVISSTAIDVSNAEGCVAFPADSLAGAIALIPRGTCTFEEKNNFAAAAGAVATLIYNNVPGEPLIMAIEMATTPALMISQSNGEAILAQLEAGQTVGTMEAAITPIVDAALADHVAPSSSRGPNGDPNVLKPDLAAPGTSILSAMSVDDPYSPGQEYDLLTGTSMASPHVAGAAALLVQQHPQWSAVEIKTALTSSSQRDGLLKEDGFTPADAFDVGAGRLDLSAASQATLTFNHASYANAACSGSCRFHVNATNRGTQAQSWQVGGDIEGAKVLVSPSEITLDAGESAEIIVHIAPDQANLNAWQFGQLNFNGITQAHLPLAVYPDAASSSVPLRIWQDEDGIAPNEQDNFHVQFNNRDFDNEFTVTVNIPDELSLLPSSARSLVANGSEKTLEEDLENGELRWQGTLEQAALRLESRASLALSSIATAENQLACSATCDEVSFTLTVPEFEFNGERYSELIISDNGFIVAGSTGNLNGAYNNQDFPSEKAPNNILAPLWSDFDLLGTLENDTGHGSLHVQLVALDSEQDNYLVVEWSQAQLFEDLSGNTYSFQILLGINDAIGEIHFNYLDIPVMPANVSIGAEDATALLGVSYHFNGAGSAVNSGDTLSFSASTVEGTVLLDMVLQANDINLARSIETTTQASQAITIPVITQGSDELVLWLTASASDGTTETPAAAAIPVNNLAVAGLEIITEPTLGRAEIIDENSILYTPQPGYNGSVQIEYRLLDSEQNGLGQAFITVLVESTNGAPTASAPSGATEVNAGSNLVLTLVGSDPDGDTLAWTVTQLSGPATTFEVNGDQLTITAPSVSSNETIVFRATASDGEFDSNSVEFSLTVIATDDGGSNGDNGGGDGDSGSGGGLGWGALLLALFAVRQRCWATR